MDHQRSGLSLYGSLYFFPMATLDRKTIANEIADIFYELFLGDESSRRGDPKNRFINNNLLGLSYFTLNERGRTLTRHFAPPPKKEKQEIYHALSFSRHFGAACVDIWCIKNETLVRL